MYVPTKYFYHMRLIFTIYDTNTVIVGYSMDRKMSNRPKNTHPVIIGKRIL